MNNMRLAREPYPYDMPPQPQDLALQRDPWEIPPKLTRQGTLRDVLRHDFASVLAAHVLAHVRGSDLDDAVRYQPAYHGPGAGRSRIKDLEHRGIIYREFQGLIYTKRVG